jgi:hypothetical protein
MTPRASEPRIPWITSYWRRWWHSRIRRLQRYDDNPPTTGIVGASEQITRVRFGFGSNTLGGGGSIAIGSGWDVRSHRLSMPLKMVGSGGGGGNSAGGGGEDGNGGAVNGETLGRRDVGCSAGGLSMYDDTMTDMALGKVGGLLLTSHYVGRHPGAGHDRTRARMPPHGSVNQNTHAASAKFTQRCKPLRVPHPRRHPRAPHAAWRRW